MLSDGRTQPTGGLATSGFGTHGQATSFRRLHLYATDRVSRLGLEGASHLGHFAPGLGGVRRRARPWTVRETEAYLTSTDGQQPLGHQHRPLSGLPRGFKPAKRLRARPLDHHRPPVPRRQGAQHLGGRWRESDQETCITLEECCHQHGNHLPGRRDDGRTWRLVLGARLQGRPYAPTTTTPIAVTTTSARAKLISPPLDEKSTPTSRQFETGLASLPVTWQARSRTRGAPAAGETGTTTTTSSPPGPGCPKRRSGRCRGATPLPAGGRDSTPPSVGAVSGRVRRQNAHAHGRQIQDVHVATPGPTARGRPGDRAPGGAAGDLPRP